MQTRAAARRAQTQTQLIGQATELSAQHRQVNDQPPGGILSPNAQPQGPQKTSKKRKLTTAKRNAAADADLDPSSEGRARRSRRVRVAKPSLPSDVLPHGLGKIHTIQDNPTATPDQAQQATSLKIESAADSLTLEVVDFVREIIEQAVISIDENPAHPKQQTAPLSPPDEETNGRALRRGARRGRAKLDVAAALATPESSFTATGDDFNVVDGKGKPSKDTNRKREPRRTKANPYGLMPGRTPFPDLASPSAEACREVHRILTETHGEFKAPDKIPAPSTSVAGCGEVPDLVDALIRTLISGHTAMANANLAIQDVIAKYGQWDSDSIGAGSIDWNKVRLSEEAEVVEAVKRAGLGPTKGKDIKLILEQVYQDNKERRAAYIQEKATGEATDMSGARDLTQGQKDHQLLKIENGVLTMDHIRVMTPDEAMLEFTKYPGIGVKTASCLILFCLQQPSFAVDTHVWRFCKWLKWVPPKASRDDTYMHGEVRIPNDLKYGLHQLFIRHGKECGRCRSGTVEGTAEWDEVVCPLEHLLDRFDKRKTKALPKPKKFEKKQKARKEGDDEGKDDETSLDPEASIKPDKQPVRSESATETVASSTSGSASISSSNSPGLAVQLRRRKKIDYAENDIVLDDE